MTQQQPTNQRRMNKATLDKYQFVLFNLWYSIIKNNPIDFKAMYREHKITNNLRMILVTLGAISINGDNISWLYPTKPDETLALKCIEMSNRMCDESKQRSDKKKAAAPQIEFNQPPMEVSNDGKILDAKQDPRIDEILSRLQKIDQIGAQIAEIYAAWFNTPVK